MQGSGLRVRMNNIKNLTMKHFLLFLFILLCSKTEAQTIYAVSNEKKIYRIEDDYTSTYLSTVSSTPFLIGDIAISPNGTMYGIAYDSIYQINPLTGQATFIVSLPHTSYPALVCSNDYELYTISDSGYLYKYDILTSTITNMEYLGFATSGDLTFYRGNLIFQTWANDVSVYMVKAYNLETGQLVDIFCHPNYFQLWGLTTKYVDCNNGTVLAVNPANQLLDIDFNSQTYTQIPFTFPSGETIYGLASTNEHLGSLCTPENLTDLDCENLSNNYLAYNKPFIYPTFVENQLFWENFDEVTTVWVYDITGKIILKKEGTSIISIVVDNFEKGIYVLKLENKYGSFTQKFIKK